MNNFAKGNRVRIDWPGTELHDRTATVLHDATIKTGDTYVPAYAIDLDRPDSWGCYGQVIPADRLVPEGGG